MAKDIFIDVETYSSVDIRSAGAYKYIESPDFEILLVGYALDDQPVRVIDLLQGDELPKEFEEALFDQECRKHAHNANFERQCFKRICFDIPISEWHCTAVKSAYCGLPFSLDEVSKRLNIANKKLDTGKALIKYFSCPCKPTKINGKRSRNYPEHAPDKWELYKEYNRVDVEAEREIYNTLSAYDIPDFERQLYILDQRINDNGVLVDMTLAKSAVAVDEAYTEMLTQRAKEITRLDNPNSPTQIRRWIESVTGETVTSLAKDALPQLFEDFKAFEDVIEILNIRKKMSKTSIKKYTAMLNCAMEDDRVRGTFQFYGASRTGRWAGRLLQLQNLSKNYISNIELPRQLIRERDWDTTEMLYGDVSSVLSQLVRTALVAPTGMTFAVADFAAIEARVVSWLADEEWRIDVFKGDGKIYEAAGARMFNVPIEAITKTSDLRAKAKNAELALGYQGSLGAMKRMGGDKMGMSDVEMMSIVRKWRDANPKIVELWRECEDAAHEAVRYQRKVVATKRNIVFDCDDKYMTVQLPSGRKLFYSNPHFKMKTVGKSTRPIELLHYDGLEQKTKQWLEIDTYGGKLVENIVQAMSRDLLGFAMLNLQASGFWITMHIHDEFIIELLKDGKEQDVYEHIVDIASKSPDWALDLPLAADGYITDYYKKD